jgi:hypothetical protein
MFVTWSRVTWKGELTVTTSMADGGTQGDGGIAAHAQRHSVALNRRARCAGLSLEAMGGRGVLTAAGARRERTATRHVACGTSR